MPDLPDITSHFTGELEGLADTATKAKGIMKDFAGSEAKAKLSADLADVAAKVQEGDDVMRAWAEKKWTAQLTAEGGQAETVAEETSAKLDAVAAGRKEFKLTANGEQAIADTEAIREELKAATADPIVQKVKVETDDSGLGSLSDALDQARTDLGVLKQNLDDVHSGMASGTGNIEDYAAALKDASSQLEGLNENEAVKVARGYNAFERGAGGIAKLLDQFQTEGLPENALPVPSITPEGGFPKEPFNYWPNFSPFMHTVAEEGPSPLAPDFSTPEWLREMGRALPPMPPGFGENRLPFFGEAPEGGFPSAPFNWPNYSPFMHAIPQMTQGEFNDRADQLQSNYGALIREAKLGMDKTEFDEKLAAARGELDILTRTKRVGLDLDISGDLAKVAELKAAEDAAGGGGGGGGGFLSSLGGAFGNVPWGPIGWGALIGLIPAAVAAAGPLLAGAGAAGTALYGTFSDVIPAISAYSTAQTQTPTTNLQNQLQNLQAAQQLLQAKQQVSQAKSALEQQEQQSTYTVNQAIAQANNTRITSNYQVLQSQEALKNATVSGNYQVLQSQQSLATAQLNAANSLRTADQAIVPAEEAVTNAVFNEQQAQLALVQARLQAQFQLQDYTNQLKDAALAQEGSYLAAKQAAITLQQTLATPATTQLQREEAMLAYQQAIQGIQDQKTAYSQLQINAAIAAKQGVSGNTAVVQALHAVKVAQEDIRQSIIALSDARINKSQAETQAVLSIKQAVQALHQAEYQRSQSELQAEQAVKQAIYQRTQANQQATAALKEARITANEQLQAARIAYRESLQAQTSAKESVKLTKELTSATSQLSTALAGLSPAAKDFVKWFEGGPFGFSKLQNQMEGILLPLLKSGLQDLEPLFKAISPIIKNAASGIGLWFDSMAKWASHGGMKEIVGLFREGNGVFSAFGNVMSDLIKVIIGMGPEGTKVLLGLASGLDSMVKIMGQWAQSAPGRLYFTSIAQILRNGGKAFADFVKVLLDVIPHLLPLLVPIIKLLDQLLIVVDKFVTAPGFTKSFDAFVKSLSNAVKEIAHIVSDVDHILTVVGAIGKVIGIGKDIWNAGQLIMNPLGELANLFGLHFSFGGTQPIRPGQQPTGGTVRGTGGPVGPGGPGTIHHHHHHHQREAVEHMDVAHLHLDKAHLTAMTTVPTGGHVTINLHITGPLDVHDKAFTREIAHEIREELIKLGKRNGSIYGQYAGVRTGRTRGA